MEPLYFDNQGRQLYGVYHEPGVLRNTNSGVVLCYPVGDEYMRIHRAYRWLADRLAAQGFHVLRFDYSGTGNSSNDLEDARFPQWLDDLRGAISELRAISGAASISLIGLRIGALLAATCAAEFSAKALVLWDPIPDGATYRRRLQTLIEATANPRSDFIDAQGALHYAGFRYGTELLRSAANLCLSASALGDAGSVLVVDGGPEAQARMTGSAAITWMESDAPADWDTVDDMGGLFLPTKTLSMIVNWVDQHG